MIRRSGTVLVAVLLVCVWSAPAQAATRTVTSLADSGTGSLRATVAAAGTGDTIVLPAGKITLTSVEIPVTKALTIQGKGAGTSVISGNDHSRIFNATQALTLQGVTLSRGLAADYGGAVRTSAASLALSGVVMESNRAAPTGDGFGGAIYAPGPVAIQLTNTTIRDNVAGGGASKAGFGGAIDFGTGTSSLTVTNSRITGNVAGAAGADGFGGAIIVDGTGQNGGRYSMTFTNSVVAGNAAGPGGDGFGGAIETSFGGNNNTLALTITGTAFNGNGAGGTAAGKNGYGASIDTGAGGTGNTGTFSVSNSSFSGNRATFGNATFSENTVTSAAFTNVTVSGNATDRALNVPATATMKNTVVAGNTGQNCATASVSQGRNLSSDATCGFTGPGDRQNTNARLLANGFYGGPVPAVPFDFASPALNAATGCPATDVRGVPRPQGGGCDIGAYELKPASAVTGAAAPGLTAAKLGGTITPDIGAGSYSFQYGKTTAYGLAAGGSAPPSQVAQAVSATVAGLDPGTVYHYRLVARNPLGNVAGADQTFRTAAAAIPSVPAIASIPSVSRFAIKPRRFRVAKAATARTARSARRKAKIKRGAAFGFRLSGAGTVSIAIAQRTRGRRVNRRCRAPKRKYRRKPRCTRYVKKGTLTRKSLKAGQNTVRFSGRIGRRALGPGRYRAVIRSSTPGRPGTSKARIVTFTVLKG